MYAHALASVRMPLIVVLSFGGCLARGKAAPPSSLFQFCILILCVAVEVGIDLVSTVADVLPRCAVGQTGPPLHALQCTYAAS